MKCKKCKVELFDRDIVDNVTKSKFLRYEKLGLFNTYSVMKISKTIKYRCPSCFEVTKDTTETERWC